MKHTILSLPLSHSFSTLGEEFFSFVRPTPFTTASELVHYNTAAASLLDLHDDAHQDSALVEILSGTRILPESKPLASLYAGHQFGHFVSQLGDGRAILLAETINQQGEKWEIQLKGSGLTPYSRDGDGRAVLRSTIREYLCSEAIHALGIPTTRGLCLVCSEDEVYRENIEYGAILTRLAPSHIRFGSFEVFYYRNQFEQIRTLADYVIKHHFPEIQNTDNPYLCWFDQVIDQTAKLIAQWQAVGFAHGVMNSDNMSVLGLTIDYGPYGFMEAYDPAYICNHSDHQGRYAFNQQPDVGLFNLSCFAQAILPLLHDEKSENGVEQAVETAKEKLESYYERYMAYYAENMRAKLGLREALPEDQELTNDLLGLMAEDAVDYTILFRKLCEFNSASPGSNQAIRDLFINREKFDQWAVRYQQRLAKEAIDDESRRIQMAGVNPKYILRNYMAETAIRKAEAENDYSEVERLFTLLQSPYDEQPEFEVYADFPPDWAKNISVSCSS